MKKLFFLLVPAFMLVACCNNEPKQEAAEGEHKCCNKEGEHKCCKDGEHKCHHEMSEEQKADMAAWEDWANQTDEKKAELLNKRKECFDKMVAEKKAREEEMAAKKAAFEEGMANWDNLSLDEKKALFDNMPCCGEGHHHGCGHKCHGDKPEGCCKGHEGCHKHEGCKGHEGHEGCEHHHEGCPNHKD